MLTSLLDENHSCDLHCLLEIFYSLIMQKALIYSDWNYYQLDLCAAFICRSSVFHVLTNWIVHWFIRDQFLMCFRAINPALCALLSLPPFANITTHCHVSVEIGNTLGSLQFFQISARGWVADSLFVLLARQKCVEFFFEASPLCWDWGIADTVSRASKPRSTAAWANCPVSTPR